MADTIDQIRDAFGAALAARVERHGNTLASGFHLLSGRQVPVVVELTATDLVVLHDGGETWGDLWGRGHVDAAPTAHDRAALERVCAAHGVAWNHRERRVEGRARAAGAAEVARGLVSACLAVEGWSALYPAERTEPFPSTGELVDAVAAVAPKAGWSVERPDVLNGTMATYHPGCVLEKRGARVAIAVMNEDSGEVLRQRLVGWSYDLADWRSAIVVPERLMGQLALPFARIRLVPRRRRGTEREVVETAESLLRVA